MLEFLGTAFLVIGYYEIYDGRRVILDNCVNVDIMLKNPLCDEPETIELAFFAVTVFELAAIYFYIFFGTNL